MVEEVSRASILLVYPWPFQLREASPRARIVPSPNLSGAVELLDCRLDARLARRHDHRERPSSSTTG
jgi:hypothetical protein